MSTLIVTLAIPTLAFLISLMHTIRYYELKNVLTLIVRLATVYINFSQIIYNYNFSLL